MTNPQGDLVSGFTTAFFIVGVTCFFVGVLAGYWLHYWTARQKQADAAPAVLTPGYEQHSPMPEDVMREKWAELRTHADVPKQ